MKSIQFQHKLLLIGLTTVNCWLWQVVIATAENNPGPTSPAQSDRIDSDRHPQPQAELTQQLPPPVVPAPIKIGAPPLSVGLILNEKSVLEGINIRVYEYGEKAIDFERWLIPFDEAMKALEIKVKKIGKGETVELSWSSFRVNFDTHKLQDDPGLGRSISIADLQSIGGIKAKFDLYKYAIAITIPERSAIGANIGDDTPIDLDGLPIISAANIGIGAIQQRSNVSGGSSGDTRTSGELRAVGNIGTGSWQVRIEQPTIEVINNWNLNSATVVFPSKTTDLAIGSQQPFWGQSFGQSGSRLGGEFSTRDRRNATSIRATIDNRTRLNWNARQTFDKLRFGYQANDVSSLAEISYRIPIDPQERGEHEIGAAYQTNNSAITTTFASLSWKYRSPARNSSGRSWQSELGFGKSLFGSGIIAGIDYSIAPGWQIRGRDRGASESTNGSDFALELTTTLQTQGEIQGTDRSIEDLRGFGQVNIVPFFDRNGNSRQDPGEAGYTDPLLLEINRKSLGNFQAQTNGLISTLQLAPGSYRLDLNPAGYPISYRSKAAALQIDVIAGTTTEIPVPLIPAYAMTGVVKNSTGEPISGGRVEAISLVNGEKYTSVTNDSGVYYLEGLEQGEYRINVSGLTTKNADCKSSCDDRIQITPRTNPVLELNLIPAQQPIPPPKSITSYRHSLDRQLSTFIYIPINY